MIINSIALKQYGSYKDEVEIPFYQGTTGIVGVHDASNLRSNAAGKSTAIRAINFALYGKDEGKKIESIVNDKVSAADIDMYATVKFSHGGINYVITRGRKKTSSHLYFARIENDLEVEIGDKETDIRNKQKLINDIIGMDFDMFTATVFFEQRKADKFINTDSSKSQEYLDNVLNLDTLRAAVKLAATKTNKIYDQHKLKKSEVANTESSIQILTDEILTKDNILKSIEENKVSLAATMQSLDALVALAKSYEESEQVMNRLSTVTGKIKTINDSIVSGNAKIIALHKKIADSNEAVRTATHELSIATSDIEVLTPKIELLNTILGNLRSESLKQTSDKAEAVSEMQQFKTLLTNIEAPKCPHCNQDISADYQEQTRAFINDKITMLELRIAHAESHILLNTKSIESAAAELKLTENTIKTASASSLNASNKITNNKSIKESSEKEVLDVESQIKLNDSLLVDLTKEQRELQDKVEYIKTIDVTSTRTQMQAKTATIEKINSDIEVLTRAVGSIQEKERNCEILAASLKELRVAMEDAEDQINTYEIVSSIFKKMVDEMFSQSVKLIEYYANKLIQQVYPNFKINIYKDKTKKLEPIVFDFICDGKSREYDRLSGGQKTVADICLRLGFSKTLMDISNTKINFICLDEPFESLDEYNRELIKQILMFESRTFSQVIIISHTPDAQDFEHLIRVRMSPEGVSYISKD